MNHIKYPSTDQFRTIIKHVKDQCNYHGVPLPKITFEGTVKIHGTNSGVIRLPDGTIYAQSRENIITPENDNAGFAAFVEVNKEYFESLSKAVMAVTRLYGQAIHIYGEWFGGTIQKGVGVNGLPKQLAIFKIRVGDSAESQNWLSTQELVSVILSSEHNEFIIPIYHYGVKSILVDFNKLEEAQNKFIELTQAVEKDCPVARYHKPDAEEGTLVGEGLVWTAVDCSEPKININQMFFKTKGEKHSVSKVKTLVPIDMEKVASVEEFVENTVTENRLAQGIDILRQRGLEIESKNTGEFIKWVTQDIWKEELDTLVGNNLTQKDVGGRIATKARNYFLGVFE